MSWRTFLRTHADVIAGAAFFTAEVWTRRGLVTHYVLFVVRHATRAMHIAGVTTTPDAAFMAQVARNLTAPGDGFRNELRYVVLHRDTRFTNQFQRILENTGIEVINTAVQAPNMNAFAERWVLSVKAEYLNRMILLLQDSLRRALKEHDAPFHTELPQQGTVNALTEAPETSAAPRDRIVEHERLGGLLRSYQRAA